MKCSSKASLKLSVRNVGDSSELRTIWSMKPDARDLHKVVRVHLLEFSTNQERQLWAIRAIDNQIRVRNRKYLVFIVVIPRLLPNWTLTLRIANILPLLVPSALTCSPRVLCNSIWLFVQEIREIDHILYINKWSKVILNFAEVKKWGINNKDLNKDKIMNLCGNRIDQDLKILMDLSDTIPMGLSDTLLNHRRGTCMKIKITMVLLDNNQIILASLMVLWTRFFNHE